MIPVMADGPKPPMVDRRSTFFVNVQCCPNYQHPFTTTITSIGEAKEAHPVLTCSSCPLSSEITHLPYPSPSSTFQLQPCWWTATSSFPTMTRPPTRTRPSKAGPLATRALETTVILVKVLLGPSRRRALRTPLTPWSGLRTTTMTTPTLTLTMLMTSPTMMSRHRCRCRGEGHQRWRRPWQASNKASEEGWSSFWQWVFS